MRKNLPVTAREIDVLDDQAIVSQTDLDGNMWHTLRSSMLRPLARALQGARGIAAGDLSGRFDSDSDNEVGQLLRALQQMNSNLIATIGDVRSNVDSIGVATRDIATGNRDLAGRTHAPAQALAA